MKLLPTYRFVALAACLTLLWTPPTSHAQETAQAEAADPAQASKVVAGIGSADRVLDALEYMIVDLAGKKTTWENDVKPNIEIFLIGLSYDQPVRGDQIFDPTNGARTQVIVPIADLDDFLDDNLEPIDIDSDRDRRDRNLYQLGVQGNVYDGWLRYIPEPQPYAVIFPQREFLDNLEGLVEDHKPFTNELAFLSLVGTKKDMPIRQAGWDAYSKSVLDEFQKLPTESREAFDLRKRMRQQSLMLFGQWFSETSNISLKVNVNREQGDAPSKLLFTALPETPLESNIERILTDPSRFAVLKTPENALVSFRVNLPVDAERAEGYKEIYEMARPVVDEKIDASDDASESEKVAQKEVVNTFLNVLRDSMQSPIVDGFADIIPMSGGKNTLVMGIEHTAQADILKILRKLPEAITGWKLEENVDEVAGTPIHRLKLGENSLKSLGDFYGNSGEVFIGVSEDVFWLSGGPDSLNVLKSRIQTVADAPKPEADGVLVSLKMQSRPILVHLDAFVKEANLDVLDIISVRQRLQASTGEQEGEGERRGRRAAGNLANFQWEQTAIDAMDGLDDRLQIVIKRTERGTLEGSGNAQIGMLKALGAIVAKFAEENLR